MMTLILLLALIIVSKCDSSSVVGRTGQDVILPCKYDIKYYNAREVCWGKGRIPASGCNNQLIATDGQKVIEGTRSSSKYQLLGRLDKGDVSLTILNVSEADAGQYGCRVDIPGWFNDAKHHHDLKVERVLQTTTSTTLSTETSTQQPAANYTQAGQATSTELTRTSSSSSVTAEDESSLNVVLVCVLFGLVALVLTGVILFIARKRKLKNHQQQQANDSVQYSTTPSTLHLQSRGSAVENIYQIDGGVDGSEYEYCP